jgi:hypothetical protein
MAAKNIQYVSEEQQQEYEEIDFATYADNKTDFESEMSEPRCPDCNKLLAWHENTCAVVPLEAVAMPATVVRASVTRVFAYELGHQVLPVTSTAPRIVTWRSN